MTLVRCKCTLVLASPTTAVMSMQPAAGGDYITFQAHIEQVAALKAALRIAKPYLVKWATEKKWTGTMADDLRQVDAALELPNE